MTHEQWLALQILMVVSFILGYAIGYLVGGGAS